MKLANRMASLAPSASLELSAEVRRLRAAGRDVVDFGVGELDFATVRAAKAAGRDAIERDFSRYTPTPGVPELREAIARWHAGQHGSAARAEDVVVGAGAKPMLFELLQVLVDPGDDVVVQEPYWVSFPAQVALAGGRFVAAPMDAARGFAPTAAAIESALTARTKVVVMNSPCNPTGAIVAEGEMQAIVELCADRGIALVADEVYDRLIYEGRHVSPLQFADRHPGGIACVGSASKTFAMTGWRLGYAIAPGELGQAVARLQGHVTSCASSISQAACLGAFQGGEAEVAAMVAELRARRDLALAALDGVPGVRCPRPAGTFFLFPEIDLGTGRVIDSARLAARVLDAAGVACVPGAAFGREGHLRVSYAVRRAELERGLEALVAEIRRLRADPSLLR